MAEDEANRGGAEEPHAFVPRTVLPGDDVTDIIESSSAGDTAKGGNRSGGDNTKPKGSTAKFKLGTGLSYDAETESVRATRAGMLVRRPGRPGGPTYLVLCNSKRYVPRPNDRVVGVVEERLGPDAYRVNIFGPHPAILPSLAFEGATKRNRPNLRPGSLLYCRVTSSHPDVDPELSCKVGGDGMADGGAARRDWMTDEGTYGELRGGTTLRISLGLARELIHPRNVVLNSLGGPPGRLPFEIAIGVNGLVWVHSTRPEHTILICNAIKNSEVLTEEQTRGMVKAMVRTVTSAIAASD